MSRIIAALGPRYKAPLQTAEPVPCAPSEGSPGGGSWRACSFLKNERENEGGVAPPTH